MTLAFPPLWQEQLKTLGFEQLTEIQERLFEPITQGENVLGVSPTGPIWAIPVRSCYIHIPSSLLP